MSCQSPVSENRFGTGELVQVGDMPSPIYAECTACMSIYSEFLSWANACSWLITKDPAEAGSILVLSCQVTDLAILNDFRTIESLQKRFPGKSYYIGGCLAQRFDIPFPEGVQRADHIRSDKVWITDTSLVKFAPPFWTEGFEEGGNDRVDGKLFRYDYPLRIGVGCHKKCAYCSIRTTRGKPYEIPAAELQEEFLAMGAPDRSVLLVADSPSVSQIREWCVLAIAHHRPISLRNVEPDVAMQSLKYLMTVAKLGLLDKFLCPVQSDRPEVLKDMHRLVEPTLKFINIVPTLRAYGVYCSTNVIVDYKGFPDPSLKVAKVFDQVGWNPYWDGTWDRAKAEERFAKFFPWTVKE